MFQYAILQFVHGHPKFSSLAVVTSFPHSIWVFFFFHFFYVSGQGQVGVFLWFGLVDDVIGPLTSWADMDPMCLANIYKIYPTRGKHWAPLVQAKLLNVAKMYT